jgi:hypothetical protein
MNAMREIAPMEVKESCEECMSRGVLYFNNIDKLTEYMERRYMYFDQHLAPIQQYVREGHITCPICNSSGFITKRI